MAYIKPSGQQCKYEEQDGMQEHVSVREKARQGNIHRVGICVSSELPETNLSSAEIRRLWHDQLKASKAACIANKKHL